MKKIVCSLILCFLVSGCTSSTNAKDIYTDTISYMNESVYYFKSEEKNYMHEELSNIKNTEILVDENDIVYSIVENKFGDNGNGITTVSDGKDIHRLEIAKEENKQEYTIENVGDVKKVGTFFSSIFDEERIIIVDSKVQKNGKEKKLTFNCTVDVDDEKVALDSKYIISIKDNYITEVEYLSYPFGGDVLTQHTITKYMDFNTAKSIDTDSVIKEMEVKGIKEVKAENFSNEYYANFSEVKNIVHYYKMSSKDVKVLSEEKDKLVFCLTVDKVDVHDESVLA